MTANTTTNGAAAAPAKPTQNTITYTLLSDTPSPQLDDDVVAYQPRAGGRVKTVRGAQTLATGKEEVCGVSWDWRGKGLIRVASAHWELLGWGGGEEEEGNAWMVTFFTKTVFTAEGVNVYSRRAGGVGGRMLEEIRQALVGTGHPSLGKLAGKLYEVASGDAVER